MERLHIRIPAAALLAVHALATACATPPEALEPRKIERPVAERISAEAVRIRWPAGEFTGPVTIFSGPAPDAMDLEHPLGFGVTGTVVVKPLDPEVRHYFLLVSHDGAPERVVAVRRLPLRGADNFRDLGGYGTTDGRTVRWGRLYRSDDLSGLTSADVSYLSRLGLELVCDLRSQRERERKPDREIVPDPPRRLDLPIDAEGTDPVDMREKIRTGGITALELEQTMLDAYRAFVTDHSEEFAAMFRRISQPDSQPALVHCTAGKDRTGFASAMVLLALGVPREVVVEDYLRTNFYLESFHRFVLRWVPLYSLFRTDPEDLLPLLEARREYLEASFDAIEEGYGSVDAYLEEALGVGPEQRAALRANLLR